MRVVSRSDNRIRLESDTHFAAVSLNWRGDPKTWLLTAYEKKDPVGPGRTMDRTGDGAGGLTNSPAADQAAANVLPSARAVKATEGEGQGDFMAALQPVLDADDAIGGRGDPDLADTLAAAARAAADRTPDARRIEADIGALDAEIARATAAGRDLTGDPDLVAARTAVEDGDRQAGVADAAAACLRRGLG
jgi:hypothetical protein